MWSKKSIKSENKDTLEVETFNGNKSIVYKLKDEIIENLIKINNGKNKRKK